MKLRDALDRTILLIRDEVTRDTSDEEILGALCGTRVALIADAGNIRLASAQTAFVTGALVMARSGHQVSLLAPDLPLVGAQPPLGRGPLVTELTRIGTQILPDYKFTVPEDDEEFDLAIAVGDSPIEVKARRRIRLVAGPWDGGIAPDCTNARWRDNRNPFGAMVAAALAATEAFKITMQKLAGRARNPARMAAVFGFTDAVSLALAPPGTPCPSDIGRFDCVSAGAITNTILYALCRIPGVHGVCRVIDDDGSEITNLNRYMLLLLTELGGPKVSQLSRALSESGLFVQPVAARFSAGQVDSLLPLARDVLIGVDHIPTRWDVQRAKPDWLAVGATTHWSAMASFHSRGAGCAQCLHPIDDPTAGPIPTVAFVSFWAGLLTAAYFIRHVAGENVPIAEQQVYITPVRAELPVRSVVPVRLGCPSCSSELGAAPFHHRASWRTG